MDFFALPSSADVDTALQLTAETAFVDFKSTFHPDDKGSFLEIVKDIAAMANSGGGVIIIGLDNSGVPTNFSLAACMTLDPAKVTDTFYKYTDTQFDNFSLVKAVKDGSDVFCILVGGTLIPLVFSQTGNYAELSGK